VADSKNLKNQEEEVWRDLDNYLISVLIPNLKKLKDKGISYPSVLKSRKKWEKILSKMIEGFEILEKDEYWYPDNVNKLKDIKKIKKSQKLLSKWFSHLWD